MGIIQGGDPLSKDPAKASLYGTGGLGVLKAEISAEPHTRGAVSAVLQPGKPDSAGAQFFVCVTDQPSLTGKYTVFGRVSEGIDVVQKISEVADGAEDGLATERIEIISVDIRDTPPPEPEPFSTESPSPLAQYRAVLDTSAARSRSSCLPDQGAGARAQLPAAGRRPASSTAPPSTGSSRVSWSRPARSHTRGPLTRSSRSWCGSCRRSSTTPNT